ncbi:MAG: hypothetical protein DRJ69_03445 [Thermoprotei archaeon]|nr:MAG: hypothetical protein DRJ69_03445 [Thermoprotei archaeon]
MRDKLLEALGKIYFWIQSVRVDRGFTSPIIHIWRNSLLYCGPIIDWRYEGLIEGLLNLYVSSNDGKWLDMAIEYSKDIINALTPTGHLYMSSFEYSSFSGGTPHEFAAAKALLKLCKVLINEKLALWKNIYDAALLIINRMLTLYTGNATKNLIDDPHIVYNKCATAAEVLFLYSDILKAQGKSTKSKSMLNIAKSIVDTIVKVQRDDGAIPQGTFDFNIYPLYVARCINALIEAYKRFSDKVYLMSIRKTLEFLKHSFVPGYGFYQVIFHNGKKSLNPIWIAGMGDILRVFLKVTELGVSSYNDIIDEGMNVILSKQTPLGSIWTAYGFAKPGYNRKYYGVPDMRDIMPCIGWIDKTFSFITQIVLQNDLAISFKDIMTMVHEAKNEIYITQCLFKGRAHKYVETAEEIKIIDEKTKSIIYHWRKKSHWAKAKF